MVALGVVCSTGLYEDVMVDAGAELGTDDFGFSGGGVFGMKLPSCLWKKSTELRMGW